MLCDQCGKNPACIHMTKIINGEKSEEHLCPECAAAIQEMVFPSSNNFSVHDFLKTIFSQENVTESLDQPACPNCGMTFEDFRSSGKIGCSVCYNIFGEQFEPLLRRIHGTNTHTGKIPRRVGGQVELRMRIRGLRQDLDGCVKREDYEAAATVRDKIRLLEKELEYE